MLAVFVLVLAPMCILQGWVLSILWGWHVAPLTGWPDIGVWQAVGLVTVVDVVKGTAATSNDPVTGATVAVGVVKWLMLLTISLGVGWLALVAS